MAEPLTLQALKKLLWLSSLYTDDKAISRIEKCLLAFESIPGMTFDQKVKSLTSHWRRTGFTNKYDDEFRSFIQNADAVFEVTGPKSVRKDLAKLQKLLTGDEAIAVEDFLIHLRIEPQATTQRAARRPSPALDARAFSDHLERAVNDKEEFERLVTQLVAPRAYSMEQINEVAMRFLGYEIGFKAKHQAATALKQSQIDTVIGGAQTRRIEKLPI